MNARKAHQVARRPALGCGLIVSTLALLVWAPAVTAAEAPEPGPAAAGSPALEAETVEAEGVETETVEAEVEAEGVETETVGGSGGSVSAVEAQGESTPVPVSTAQAEDTSGANEYTEDVPTGSGSEGAGGGLARPGSSGSSGGGSGPGAAASGAPAGDGGVAATGETGGGADSGNGQGRASGSATLPRSGAEAWLLALIGAAFLAGGVGLRRRAAA
jgi:hypothetical protein